MPEENPYLLCEKCRKFRERKHFYTELTKRGYSKRCKRCLSRIEIKKVRVYNYCRWCFGYGVFAHDGKPLGIHEVKAGFPAVSCPVCLANWMEKRKSVIPPNNPCYPW